MFRVTRTTVQLDVNSPDDCREYDQILNDPNCTIIREIKEKLQDKDFGEDGKLVSIRERIMLVITYEMKKLM